jgi:transcriptional antiterminator RfaH
MLVRFGEQLAFIADDFIQDLKSHEVDGEIVHPAKSYLVGQRVHVAAGPFSGLLGTIIDMDDKERLVVLMNLLNRPVKVQVAARMVVPA